jgi:hypothetical protein
VKKKDEIEIIKKIKKIKIFLIYKMSFANYIRNVSDDDTPNILIADVSGSQYGGIYLGGNKTNPKAQFRSDASGLTITSDTISVIDASNKGLRIGSGGHLTIDNMAGKTTSGKFNNDHMLLGVDSSGKVIAVTAIHDTIHQLVTYKSTIGDLTTGALGDWISGTYTPLSNKFDTLSGYVNGALTTQVTTNKTNIQTLTGRADRIDTSFGNLSNYIYTDLTVKANTNRDTIADLSGRAGRNDISFANLSGYVYDKVPALISRANANDVSFTDLSKKFYDLCGNYDQFTSNVNQLVASASTNINLVTNSVNVLTTELGSQVLDQAKAINRLASFIDSFKFSKDKMVDSSMGAMVKEFTMAPGTINPISPISGAPITRRTNPTLAANSVGINVDSAGNGYLIQPSSYLKPNDSWTPHPWVTSGFTFKWVDQGDNNIFGTITITSQNQIANLGPSDFGNEYGLLPLNNVKTALETVWTTINSQGSNNQTRSLPGLYTSTPASYFSRSKITVSSVNVSNPNLQITDIISTNDQTVWSLPSTAKSYSNLSTAINNVYTAYKFTGLAANTIYYYTPVASASSTSTSSPVQTKANYKLINSPAPGDINGNMLIALSASALSQNNMYNGKITYTASNGSLVSTDINFVSQGTIVYGAPAVSSSTSGFTFDVVDGKLINNVLNLQIKPNSDIDLYYTVRQLTSDVATTAITTYGDLSTVNASNVKTYNYTLKYYGTSYSLIPAAGTILPSSADFAFMKL